MILDNSAPSLKVVSRNRKKLASVGQADVQTHFNLIWPLPKICSSMTKNWLVCGILIKNDTGIWCMWLKHFNKRPFKITKWQISLPFDTPQLVKCPTIYIPDAWNRHPLQDEAIYIHCRTLLYTTQVNNTFHARWLASSEVISQVIFTSEQPKKNKMAFVRILSQ